jgi:pimeloyl-ACP methyl ester carboxylesterase
MNAFDMPQPLRDDNIVRDGVRIGYRLFGAQEARGAQDTRKTHGAQAARETVLLLPSWIITPAEIWARQVSALAERFRVVVIDGRGTGLSGRPQVTEAYRTDAFAADALAVLDAVGVETAHLVGLSFGGHLAALLAARHPRRVASATLIAPAAPFGASNPAMSAHNFLAPWNGQDGWGLFNRQVWLKDYERFARFFVAEAVGEPGAEALIARGIRWALRTDGPTLVHSVMARAQTALSEGEALYRQIRCPVQVLHGECDRIVPVAKGRHVAALLGAPFRLIEGAGHVPVATRSAEVNRMLVSFLDLHGARAPAAVA